eukprot:gene5376-9183_t
MESTNKPLFILLFIVFVGFVHGKGCVLYQNSYISYEPTNYNGTSSMLIKFFTLNRQGWSGIGFSESVNVTSSKSFIVGHLPSNIVEFENLTSKSTHTQLGYKQWDFKWNFYIDNVLGFHFTLPKSYFQNQKFVFFIFNKDKDLGNKLDYTEIGTREISLLNDSSINCFDQLVGIGRIDSIHPAPFAISLAAYFIIAIVCFFMFIFKLRPIYIRRFAPMLGTILQMIILTTYGILNFATTNEFRNHYLCYFEGYLIYPAVECVYIVVLLNFIRYLLIINLNRIRIKLFNENEKNKIKFISIVKIIKRLTSPIVVVLVTLAYIIFLMIVFSIILSIFKFQCNPLQRTLFNLTHLAFTGLIGILIVGFQVFDFLVNLPRLISCKISLIDFFIRKDPFFFRLEMISSIPLIIYFVGYSVAGLSGITVFVFNYIVYFWLFSVTTLFSVVVTIIQLIIKKYRDCKSSDEFKDKGPVESCFKDGELYLLFHEFAKSEWSLENLYIKNDLLKYKKLKEISSMKKMANEIYAQYLNGSEAPMEVNVDTPSRMEVKKNIEEEKIDENLFSKIEATISKRLHSVYTWYKIKRCNVGS